MSRGDEFHPGQNVIYKPTKEVFTVRDVRRHRGKVKLNVGPKLGPLDVALFEPVKPEEKKVRTSRKFDKKPVAAPVEEPKAE